MLWEESLFLSCSNNRHLDVLICLNIRDKERERERLLVVKNMLSTLHMDAKYIFYFLPNLAIFFPIVFVRDPIVLPICGCYSAYRFACNTIMNYLINLTNSWW